MRLFSVFLLKAWIYVPILMLERIACMQVFNSLNPMLKVPFSVYACTWKDTSVISGRTLSAHLVLADFVIIRNWQGRYCFPSLWVYPATVRISMRVRSYLRHWFKIFASLILIIKLLIHFSCIFVLFILNPKISKYFTVLQVKLLLGKIALRFLCESLTICNSVTCFGTT